jgi:hypothetical protein
MVCFCLDQQSVTSIISTLSWQGECGFQTSFLVLFICIFVTGLPSHRTADHILSLFFEVVNSVKEVNPSHLPVLLFYELLMSQSCTTTSEHLYFISIIEVEHFLT